MTAQLFDALGEGFFKVDPHGYILSINEAGAQALGYSGSQALLDDASFGRGFLAHFPEWQRWLEELALGDFPSSRRFEFHRRNGARLVIEAVILERLAVDNTDASAGEGHWQGDVGGPVFVGAFQDVTASEQLASDLVERNAELESLRQLAMDAVRLEEKPDLFARMLHSCVHAVGADGGALYVQDVMDADLVLEACEGLPLDFVEKVRRIKPGESHTGTTAQTKVPYFIENAASDPALDLEELRRIDMNNFVTFPLLIGDRLLGVLNLFTVGPSRFSTRDVGLLKALSAQMSLSVAHVLRIEELRERNEELEKFNRLAIDRELRMIELKKRIADLEEQHARDEAVVERVPAPKA